MKLGILVIATLAIALGLAGFKTQPAHAETLEESAPEAIAPETTSKLQQVLDAGVREQGIPGAVMYISTPEGIWMGASGVANMTTKTPMKPSDRFRIASMSKMFVAVVVLQLVEEDQLSLDGAIADYLPQEVSDRIPNREIITIRELLNHTSGLFDYLYTEGFSEAIEKTDPSHVWTAGEAIKYVYDLEPEANPGEKHSYCNTNYILLELIVEQVTGNTLAKEMRSRILTPLQLNDTFTEMREPIPGGFVHGYEDWDGDGKRDDVTRINGGNGLGDGGLISTAKDVGRFLQGLLVNEELLEPETLNEMLMYVNDGQGGQYGLGIASDESNWGEALGHSGRSGGFLSTSWYLPDYDVTAVVLTNDADNASPDDIVIKGLEVVLGEAEE